MCLHQERWTHIIRGHVEFDEYDKCIKHAIFDPDMVVLTGHEARYPGAQRRTSCKLGAHPLHSTLYVVVPIEYCSDGHNFVVTAHLSFDPPKGDLIYVSIP